MANEDLIDDPAATTQPVTDNSDLVDDPGESFKARHPRGNYPVANFASKVLGYPTDLLKTAAMTPMKMLAQKISGNDPKQGYFSEGVGDAVNALLGNAPTSSQQLEGAGVPELGRLKKLFPKAPVDVTGRDVLGGGLEALAGYLSGKVGGPLMEKMGEAAYKVPFGKADALAKKYGMKPPSQTMLENDIAFATPDSGLNKAEGLLKDKFYPKRQSIVDAVEETGATGSEEKALADAQDYVNQLKKSHDAQDNALGERLQKDLDAQRAKGEQPPVPAIPEVPSSTINVPSSILDQSGKPIMKQRVIPGSPAIPAQEAIPGPTIKDLLQAKSSTSGKVNDEAFNRLGQTAEGQKYLKAKAGGFKKESEALADKAIPSAHWSDSSENFGAGKELGDVNKDISSLYGFLPEAQKKALISANKQPITQIDAMLMALDPMAELAKIGGKVITQPAPWTFGGRGMIHAGGLARKMSPAIGLWQAIRNQENNQ